MKLRVSPKFRFFMAFATLALFTFASALDATLLGNALPVCNCQSLSTMKFYTSYKQLNCITFYQFF